jgi:hypothetical protein
MMSPVDFGKVSSTFTETHNSVSLKMPVICLAAGCLFERRLEFPEFGAKFPGSLFVNSDQACTNALIGARTWQKDFQPIGRGFQASVKEFTISTVFLMA